MLSEFHHISIQDSNGAIDSLSVLFAVANGCKGEAERTRLNHLFTLILMNYFSELTPLFINHPLAQQHPRRFELRLHYRKRPLVRTETEEDLTPSQIWKF